MFAMRKRVKFSVRSSQPAREVKLCGDFTNWQQNAIVMKGSKSGEWTATVNLESGEHQYKFLVDGNWQLDPAAEKQVYNDFGAQNSVRNI